MISYLYESCYNLPSRLTKDFTINYKIYLYKILIGQGASNLVFGVDDLYVGVEFVGVGACVYLPVSHECKVAINDNTFNHLKFLIGACIYKESPPLALMATLMRKIQKCISKNDLPKLSYQNCVLIMLFQK